MINISFQSEYTINEQNIICNISENDFNFSYNPTLIKSGSDQDIENFVTSSFYPYITTVGLYNDNNELLAVAKLPKPIIKPDFTELNFLIKFDR